MFNKDLEELKSKQTMMNNTINEYKNSLEGINNRITEAEERISDLKDKTLEITNTDYRGPRSRRETKGTEKVFEEIIVENFPNMGQEILNQV